MKMTSLAIATLGAVLALGMAAPDAQAAGDRDDRRGHHGWDDRGRGHDRDRRDDRGNYLLVAVATGIIADLLLHH